MKSNDKQWQEFNKQLIEHAQNAQWGLYRNTRFDMAEFLRKAKRLENALENYLEVCYLDLNGPSNYGPIDDEETRKGFPAFDPKTAFLAPAAIHRISRIAKKLEFGLKEISELFIKHNKKVEQALKLPLSPEGCWEKVKKELQI